MDRVKKVPGMSRGASATPVWEERDESLVLFGELYRHDQEKDVNLLEPMYSVEFEAIQGDRRLFKLASGKKNYLLTDGEKNDYDWLKTPPATPLFRSLDMEADSPQMVFQRELPLLQPVKTSRFSKKPETPSITSTRSESPTTSSSSKSATPTARPSSSSKKHLTTRGFPALSKEETSAYKIEKRSSYTPLGNRQHNAVAFPTSTTDTKATKKISGKKPTVPGSTNAEKNIAAKPPMKNIAAAARRARTKDPSVGAKDLKVVAGNGGATRRKPCPPAAATATDNRELNAVAPRGRSRGDGEPATGNARAAEAAVEKGRRRAGGEKEKQRQEKLGSHAKKSVG